MSDTVFIVTTIDGDIENKPDVFHYLEDAREYLIECLERMGVDANKCEYTEFTDVNGMESQHWKHIDTNGWVTIGHIEEYELKEFTKKED